MIDPSYELVVSFTDPSGTSNQSLHIWREAKESLSPDSINRCPNLSVLSSDRPSEITRYISISLHIYSSVATDSKNLETALYNCSSSNGFAT